MAQQIPITFSEVINVRLFPFICFIYSSFSLCF